MTTFGDVRSAVHARDLRALIEVVYADGQYALDGDTACYVQAVLPEYEHEVWVWSRAMVERLLEVTNVPLEMVRGFAATWAEWMLDGSVDEQPIYLSAGAGTLRSYGYISLATHDYGGDPPRWYTQHELSVDIRNNPSSWFVKWGYGYD